MQNYIDQTILLPTKNEQDYDSFFNSVLKYNFFAVCIPPFKVKSAKKILHTSQTQICSVVGFPNGHNLTQIKKIETELALKDGCDEIDMVANISWIKSKSWNKIEKEISEIKSVCKNKILKVIVESSLLDDDEIISCCKAVVQSGADFIKTSTGFLGPGAKKDHIELMKKSLQNSQVKIKASGGIRDLKTAKEFIKLGCSRLGTSSGISIAKEFLGDQTNEITTSSDY